MQTEYQKPDGTTIPDFPGAVLRSQMTPDCYSVEELLTAARGKVDSEYRRRARYALGEPIPDQDADTLAIRRASLEIRRKKLAQHARKMEKQRERRAKNRPKHKRKNKTR